MLKKITKWETEGGKVFDTQDGAEEYMFEQEKIDRRWLSDSFNRGAQTLEEATASARAMVADMEKEGSLLSTTEQESARFAAWQASRKSLGLGSVELPSEYAGWFKYDKISQCWHPQYSEYAETHAKVQGWQKLYTEQQVIDLLKSVGASVKS